MSAMNEGNRPTRQRLSIEAVRAEVQNLAEIAPGWDDLYPDEQTDFEIDWSDAMARLRAIERLRAAGGLTDAEEREYLPARRRVIELMPTIEHLGLPGPKVPLD